METLTLIIALSAIMWYLIDRFKPLWENVTWGKYITIACAALGGFALTFSFGLDLLVACGLVEATSIMGQILTGLALMSGSSAISEIIEKIKG